MSQPTGSDWYAGYECARIELQAENDALATKLQDLQTRLKESSERETAIAATTGGYIRKLKDLIEAADAVHKIYHDGMLRPALANLRTAITAARAASERTGT